MLDPHNITNYEYTDAELQEFLIACICVAGKTAKVIFPKVHELLWNSQYTLETPFKTLINMEYNLDAELKRVGMGKYKILGQTLYYLPRIVANGHFDLRTCTPEKLEEFSGIGMKTSRYFIVHSRPNQKMAILDRHILRFLDKKGYPDIPDSTPSTKKQYALIESYFLHEADKSDKSVAELDSDIWSSSAK